MVSEFIIIMLWALGFINAAAGIFIIYQTFLNFNNLLQAGFIDSIYFILASGTCVGLFFITLGFLVLGLATLINIKKDNEGKNIKNLEERKEDESQYRLSK